MYNKEHEIRALEYGNREQGKVRKAGRNFLRNNLKADTVQHIHHRNASEGSTVSCLQFVVTGSLTVPPLPTPREGAVGPVGGGGVVCMG
jgi:hypothetical protein